jgi:tyrosine-protein phosphatase MSG5
MSVCRVMEADSPTLKRSFDAVRDPDIYEYCNSRKRSDGETESVNSSGFTYHRTVHPINRKLTPPSRFPAMPVQTTAPVSTTFPSFMSVFGGGMGSLQDEMREETLSNDSRGGTQLIAEKSFQTHYPLPTPYQQRESAASVNSDSTDSSPTTTISTFDSPCITDPSPSSSPESPASLLPLSPFQKMMASPNHNNKPDDPPQPSTFFPSQPRAESPASKERNVKNLSLNMSVTNARPATSSAMEGLHAFSAPTSPLRGPLKSARRRPNNLTIQTPGFEKTTFSAFEIPPTPSSRPTLKHHESSPALPSVMSPTTAPLGGMQLPPISINRLRSRPGSESSFSSLSVSSQGLHDLKEDATEVNEPPKSQEAQERGYPDGPIQIYDSGVYLYLEPTREEASKFDSVINVAKEVANPFSKPSTASKSSVMSVWRSSDHPDSPEPQTAVSDISFKSALEWPQVMGHASPTTPKARVSEPEYIHVPWDHNSEILDDLHPLCQIIENRISRGKSVLVHCQLGVSRSASLVIAYGLYKGFKTDFHSMYTSVKERSQWVGPNMSLIYQLMDFRAKVSDGEYAAKSKAAPQDWFQNAGTDSEMTPRPRLVPTNLSKASTPLMPEPTEPIEVPESSFPLSDLARPASPLTPVQEAQTAARKVSLPTALSSVSLASPSSQSMTHPLGQSSDAPPIPPRSAKRRIPRPLPLRAELYSSSNPFEIPPHTQKDVTRDIISAQVISYPSVKMDLMQDVPSTPSIFSPRTTEFRTMSFIGTDAGDLATDQSHNQQNHSKRMSVSSLPQATLAIDPRSPHQRDEHVEIMRHIDDVL